MLDAIFISEYLFYFEKLPPVSIVPVGKWSINSHYGGRGGRGVRWRRNRLGGGRALSLNQHQGVPSWAQGWLVCLANPLTDTSSYEIRCVDPCKSYDVVSPVKISQKGKRAKQDVCFRKGCLNQMAVEERRDVFIAKKLRIGEEGMRKEWGLSVS